MNAIQAHIWLCSHTFFESMFTGWLKEHLYECLSMIIDYVDIIYMFVYNCTFLLKRSYGTTDFNHVWIYVNMQGFVPKNQLGTYQ